MDKRETFNTAYSCQGKNRRLERMGFRKILATTLQRTRLPLQQQQTVSPARRIFESPCNCRSTTNCFSQVAGSTMSSGSSSSSKNKFVIPPPPIPVVPVAPSPSSASSGKDDVDERTASSFLLFPVHRIYCVARNYADHAREMGEDPDKEPPCFFAKPPDAVVDCGQTTATASSTTTATIPYPPDTSNLHHEIELVVALQSGGRRIAAAEAERHIYGLAVGVDLTRRDLQGTAKRLGRPWDAAKGFDRSAPIGPIVPTGAFSTKDGGGDNATLWLDVNGERRQTGKPWKQMIWDVPHIISILSESFELQAGDLIFTGTPAGVGPVEVGDCVTGGMDGLGEINFTLTDPL